MTIDADFSRTRSGEDKGDVIWYLDFVECKRLKNFKLFVHGKNQIRTSFKDCPVLEELELVTE